LFELFTKSSSLKQKWFYFVCLGGLKRKLKKFTVVLKETETGVFFPQAYIPNDLLSANNIKELS
jgi:hypothetical protein